jgi:hypothetical protein
MAIQAGVAGTAVSTHRQLQAFSNGQALGPNRLVLLDCSCDAKLDCRSNRPTARSTHQLGSVRAESIKAHAVTSDIRIALGFEPFPLPPVSHFSSRCRRLRSFSSSLTTRLAGLIAARSFAINEADNRRGGLLRLLFRHPVARILDHRLPDIRGDKADVFRHFSSI